MPENKSSNNQEKIDFLNDDIDELMDENENENENEKDREKRKHLPLLVKTLALFLLEAIVMNVFTVCLLGLMATGIFGGALASMALTIATSVGLASSLVFFAGIISASIVGLVFTGLFLTASLVAGLIIFQEIISPGSLSQAMKNFLKVVRKNSLKSQRYEILDEYDEYDEYMNEISFFERVKDEVKSRFSLLKKGLLLTFKILFLNFPLVVIISRSIENILCLYNNEEIVAPSEQEELINYFSPVENELEDYLVIRTLLNPIQLIQATLLWLEMVTITFSDSILQLISPVPLDAIVRLVIHGAVGALYLSLEPLKLLASIPARVVEKIVDLTIDACFIITKDENSSRETRIFRFGYNEGKLENINESGKSFSEEEEKEEEEQKEQYDNQNNNQSSDSRNTFFRNPNEESSQEQQEQQEQQQQFEENEFNNNQQYSSLRQ